MFHHCKVQEKVHCHPWFSATGAGNHSEVHKVIKKQDCRQFSFSVVFGQQLEREMDRFQRALNKSITAPQGDVKARMLWNSMPRILRNLIPS